MAVLSLYAERVATIRPVPNTYTLYTTYILWSNHMVLSYTPTLLINRLSTGQCRITRMLLLCYNLLYATLL